MASYIFFRLLVYVIGFLPFSLLYVLSDVLYYILFYIIGYRRAVVVKNLKCSFPGMDDDGINKLTKKFYHHLCDITLESIKGFTMSRKEISERHRIINPELIDYYYDKDMSVIAVPGHYNNWEWGTLSPGLQIKFPIVAFYKPMSNKRFDAFIKRHRAKYNARMASIRETALTFNKLSGKPQGYIMAADQSPSNTEECYWVHFLNQETAWLHGPEKYARRNNLPVIYVDIEKVKRGFYELRLILITDKPASLPEGEITRLYSQHLENSILREPAYWLWSHKRWKHSKEEILAEKSKIC